MVGYFLIGVSSILFATITFANENNPANPEPNDKKCEAGLASAAAELQKRVEAEGKKINKAAAPTPNNPISQLVQKMGETEAKMAELQVKNLEELKKVDNEEYQKVMELQDKLHEYRRGDFNRRAEIKKAEGDREKAKSEVRIACNAAAKAEYDKLVAGNQAKAAMTRFETNNLSKARGTRSRMKAQRNIFYQRCLTDPATKEKLKQIEDELATKMSQLKLKAEEFAADINYTQGKLPLLQAHMNDQRAHVNQISGMRMAALQKQHNNQMMALAFQAMSVASAQDGRVQSAGNLSNAQEAIDRFQEIKDQCNLPRTTSEFTISEDLVSLFREANEFCRYKCVRSNGQFSTPNRTTPGTNQSQ